MEKVVILARVSTDKQDYERQVNELTDYCRKMDWEVEKVFTNKVSGAKKNEEREEIQELISYVNSNQIRRVVCLEISRMGRNWEGPSELPERRSSSSAPRRDSAEPRPRGCSGLGEPRPALPSF